MIASETIPDHQQENHRRPVELFLATSEVASCFNCRRNKKDRATLPRGTTLCPDCGHALFWERVPGVSPKTLSSRQKCLL